MRISSSFFYSIVACVLSVNTLTAQSGRQHYQTYCSACHGNDGKGNDNAPSLVDSRWVQGEPDRAIKILLHGLKGELMVKGKNFNLMMPPQGGALKDDQVASILSYVRSSWGNDSEKVTAKQVSAIRKKNEGRTDFWEVEELLKAHPLPSDVSPISNMLMTTYEGKWKKLPDFSKLESLAVEEEHKGFVSLQEIGKKNFYGVVWTGELAVPEDGDYRFHLDSDDGSALYIDGKKVTAVVGEGPLGRWKNGKVKLKKGKHDFKLEYFQGGGGAGVYLQWEGPGLKGRRWLSDRPTKAQKRREGEMLTANGTEASMYRIFVKGCSPRSIAVAYPQKVNLVFSQDYCNYELFWQKDFIRANHWLGRGVAHVPPAGMPVVRVMKGSAFPKEMGEPKMKKITFDENRYPTFHYKVGDLVVEDFAEPFAGGFKRHLKVSSEKKIEGITFTAMQQKIAQLVVSSDTLKANAQKDTAFNLDLQKGTTSFTITYTFK